MHDEDKTPSADQDPVRGPALEDPEFLQAVRDTAYFMWEQDGRQPDRDKEYWFRALEQHLRLRQSEKELRNGV